MQPESQRTLVALDNNFAEIGGQEPVAVEAASPEAVLATLRSSRSGLDPAEAAKRLGTVGPNLLPAAKRRSSLSRFVDQFRNVLVYVLLPPAILTASLGHWLDAAVIVAVIVANAVVGWLQEGRAEEALAAVGRLLAASAVVVRNGVRQAVPAADIVPGDVVFLESGDRVPADLRLLEARGLSVDESLLTGESVPVVKAAEPVEAGLPLAERRSMVFSGTIVTGGQTLGVAVATGSASELGRIGRLVESVAELTTPFLLKLARISRQLTIAILALAAVTIIAGLLIGRLRVDELILAAVGFAVAAIPEGLPAIVTIVLAIGVRRMAARGALIRKLPAVETLGSVTVICTDKTGTLTRNELVARQIETANGRYGVEGEGYSPSGLILGANGSPAAAAGDAALRDLVIAGVRCNDARLRQRDHGWAVEGDPVEGALLALGARAGIERDALASTMSRIEVLPFESEHRFMATLDDDSGHLTGHVKGAPERLLELCTVERTASGDRPIEREAWRRRIDAMAQSGLRVLAFASGPRPASAAFDRETIGEGLAFLGIVGFIDPPRLEAQKAVADCRDAGIIVKMITGDHAATALAVASEIGLDVGAGVVTGAELALLGEEGFADVAARTNVFARVDPAQKLRLVEALQRAGHSVAMTGDGVNDAPALRRADIGVAMGGKGSDAAREAADMVLVDDNFATIAKAVREGRTVDDNLRKALRYVLPTNAGEALLLVGAILTGATLPITAIQIIWINFATEITLSLSLAFEPGARGTMARKPRDRTDALIGRRDLLRIGFVAVQMAAVAGGLFAFALGDGRPLDVARSLAVNAAVAAEVAHLLVTATIWPVRGDGGSGGRRVNVVAVAMIAAVTAMQLVVTQWRPAADALGLAPLGLADWGLVLLAGAVVFALTGIWQAVEKRRS